MKKIKQSAASEEMHYLVMFVLTYNLVSERIHYKGTPKSLLLFEIVLYLHQNSNKKVIDSTCDAYCGYHDDQGWY